MVRGAAQGRRRHRAGAFTALIPVSGALIAIVGLGERFTAGHLAALGLALLAIALATRPERPHPERLTGSG